MAEGTRYQAGATSLFPFEDLYIRYRRKLIHFFVCKGLERDVAEDLSQEAFFRFLRSDRPLESEEHARNSLFRIAQNLLIDFYRKHNGSVRVNAFVQDGFMEEQELYLVAEEADPEESLIDSETSQDVLSALSRLPSHYAQVIMLKEYEGLSYREIAAHMGVSEKSVESLLYRARSQLKEDLVETGKRRGGWWSGIPLGLRAFGDRVLGRTWRALRRLGPAWKGCPIGAGAAGAGNCALNLAVIALLLGSVVGGGVAVAVSACGDAPAAVTVTEGSAAAGAAENGREEAAVERVAGPVRGGEIPPAQGGSAAVTDDGQGPALSALLPDAGGSVERLLSGAGDTTRGLIIAAGDGLDGILVGLGHVLRSLSDPLADVLLCAGVPQGALETLLGTLDMVELRGMASGLVSAAVDATYAGEEALSALGRLPRVGDIAKTVVPPSPGGAGDGEEPAMPEGTGAVEGETRADVSSPALSEEADEQEVGTAPDGPQAEGGTPVECVVNETVNLLEDVTGGVLELLLPF